MTTNKRRKFPESARTSEAARYYGAKMPTLDPRRVLAAVEADRERESARTAALIAAARRRLARIPNIERSSSPDEAA